MMGVILLLGTAASFLSLTNTTIANNVETNLTTRYRAEAGVDAAIAYLQTQASDFLDDAEVEALVTEANELSFLCNPSACPYDPSTGQPCVAVNRWTPETIIISAIAGDPNTNAEYVAEATIRLSPSASSSPPIQILANGVTHLGSGVDLTGGTSQPYDDAIAHGNYGFSIDPGARLSTTNGEPGITTSDSYGICRGGGVVICPPAIINNQSIDTLNISAIKALVLDADLDDINTMKVDASELRDASDLANISLAEGTYISAAQLNSSRNSRSFANQLVASSDSFVVVPSSEDLVFPENTQLANARIVVQGGNIRINSNSDFNNTHIFAGNGDIVFEGNNISI